jgi:hypothetical protein
MALDEADSNLAEATEKLDAAKTSIAALRDMEGLVHWVQVAIDYLGNQSGNP